MRNTSLIPPKSRSENEDGGVFCQVGVRVRVRCSVMVRCKGKSRGRKGQGKGNGPAEANMRAKAKAKVRMSMMAMMAMSVLSRRHPQRIAGIQHDVAAGWADCNDRNEGP